MGITHIVVVHIHICPLSHYGWSNVCNQLWSIHIYSIICLFALFFIISHYFSWLFSLLNWYTFSCDTALIQWNNIFVLLLCSFGVHRPFGLWYCIWKIQHTKFLGGMCDTVKLISPLFTIYMFGFTVNNSFLYLPKLLIIVVQLIHTF